MKARRRQDELQRQRDIEEQRRHQATAREQLADAAPPPLPAQQILVHLESGDFTKALTLIVAILQERPNDREALQWLARMIEIPNMPLLQRLRAARLASEVGDQRPGVCTFEPAWCAIPGGKYSVGAQPDPYNETSFSPQKLRVRGFSIARYPVTVWQFRQFLEHPQGYASREWWTGNGWAWKQEQGASKPSRWGVREWMLPNQPVVGVSWYEAAAFCAWLTRRLRERGLLGIAELVRLPTEAEWEVAAKLDSHEGVAYVWQPPHDELWQNVAESGLSLPAPVGIFPQGQSPCGALDMAGNVWEWCGSPYDAYPPGANRLQNDYPLDKMGPALRGGAYHLSNRASGWSARTWYFPNLKHPFQGFRVVRASKWSFG